MVLNAPLTLGITCLAGDPDCDGTRIAMAGVPGGRNLTGLQRFAKHLKLRR